MRAALLTCLSVTCLAADVSSQVPAQFTPAECASISANVLSHPQRLDSLRMMYGCPAYRGATFAPLLGNASLTADTALYASIVGYAVAYKEAAIFDTAMSLASNAAAPDIARIGAIHVLISYVDLGYSSRWISELGTTLDPSALSCLDCEWVHGGGWSPNRGL